MLAALGYIATGVFVLASTLSIIEYGYWEPLDPPLATMFWIILALTIVAYFIARAVDRARGYSHDVGMTAIVCLFGAGIAYGGITFGLLPAYNAMADDSHAKTHRVKVRRYERHRRTTYRIFVDSWRPGHTEEKLFTTTELKDRAPEYVDVVSRAGALGLEYVTSVQDIPQVR